MHTLHVTVREHPSTLDVLLNRIVTKLHARDHISIGFNTHIKLHEKQRHNGARVSCVFTAYCTAHISLGSHDVVRKNIYPTDTQRDTRIRIN